MNQIQGIAYVAQSYAKLRHFQEQTNEKGAEYQYHCRYSPQEKSAEAQDIDAGFCYDQYQEDTDEGNQ